MGVAKCSQCACAEAELLNSGAGVRAQSLGLPFAEPSSGPGGELEGLSYTPLPPPDTTAVLEELLGNKLPRKPESWDTGAPQQTNFALGSTTSRSDLEPSCAKPGEPVNKVYVQFSNDLEGFLPYTLVISEEMGLEFASLAQTQRAQRSPDFLLNPLNMIRIGKLSYEELMRDAFFASLSKNLLERPELWPGAKVPTSMPHALPRCLEERIRPPYLAIVQLSMRRPILEGGQVIIFIAVQCDALASELIRSCNQLRRRRAVRHLAPAEREEPDSKGKGGSEPIGEEVPSRGFPTPRHVAGAGKDSRALNGAPSAAPSMGTASGSSMSMRSATELSPRSEALAVAAAAAASPERQGKERQAVVSPASAGSAAASGGSTVNIAQARSNSKHRGSH